MSECEKCGRTEIDPTNRCDDGSCPESWTQADPERRGAAPLSPPETGSDNASVFESDAFINRLKRPTPKPDSTK